MLDVARQALGTEAPVPSAQCLVPALPSNVQRSTPYALPLIALTPAATAIPIPATASAVTRGRSDACV